MSTKKWGDIDDESGGDLSSRMTQLGVTPVPSVIPVTALTALGGAGGGVEGTGGSSDSLPAPQFELPPLGDITEATIRTQPMVSRREIFYLDGNPVDPDDSRLVKNWKVNDAPSKNATLLFPVNNPLRIQAQAISRTHPSLRI